MKAENLKELRNHEDWYLKIIVKVFFTHSSYANVCCMSGGFFSVFMQGCFWHPLCITVTLWLVMGAISSLVGKQTGDKENVMSRLEHCACSEWDSDLCFPVSQCAKGNSNSAVTVLQNRNCS